jgi:CheY-like chemotaxis protein
MVEDTKPIRVLVIEKSQGIREFIAERVLIPNNYAPVLAGDGVEGVRKALAEVPDLVIMADLLPKLNSLEVLEALRSRPLQIPVILMTSRDAHRIDIRLLRLGVRDCVSKPFTANQLLQAIQHTTFEIQLQRDKTALANRLGQSERKIKQCLIELTIYQRIGEAILAELPLEVILERIAEAARYITQSEECFLVINDPETGDRAEKISTKPTRGIARPLVPGAASESGKPGAVAAMLHIPLKVGSREVGVLGVSNKAALRSFSDHERRMLGILVDYAAISVKMAQLSQDLTRSAEGEG